MSRDLVLRLTIFFANFIGSIPLFADDEAEFAVSALRAQNDIKWAQMTVKVLDPDGKPLVGATVRPWALRAGNGHGWWTDEAYGAPRRTTTDENGKTTIVFPESVVSFESHPVVQVSIIVTHPEFCSKNIHMNVPQGDPPAIPETSLERGVRLRIAVSRGSKQPLSDCHVLLENGDTGDVEFTADAEGWMRSIPIREDRRWFRIVRTPPGEPAQFSKVQAWNPDDPDSREVMVEVRPGIRVRGMISDAVPRPIERGHVSVICGSPVHENQGNDQNRQRPIFWSDTVEIRADGSFEFPSLPSGYLAQFYALANDWISAQPTDESYEICQKWFAEKNGRNDFFRYGQILRLTGGQQRFTIEMEPAGVVHIKCVDADGRPLRRIDVTSWPNQYMAGAGSTIFCVRRSSLDGLQGKTSIDWKRMNPFSAETNDDGEAVIRNLPRGSQSLYASNQIWMSKEGEKVESDPDKTTEVTLTLQRTPQERR